jgi:hypothetical protein
MRVRSSLPIIFVLLEAIRFAMKTRPSLGSTGWVFCSQTILAAQKSVIPTADR